MPIKPCPYCGTIPASENQTRCTECGGLFEPLSRKATQLAMGPWFVRDEDRPFMPGFSTQILIGQVRSGRVTGDTIVRGPTTNQFWQRADEVPGLSRLLGKCHACGEAVANTDAVCSSCQADLSLPDDVDTLGLAYVSSEDRAAAQAEVQAQSNAPAPPPKPTAKPKAAPKQQPLVDPNLMKDVDDESAEAPSQAATHYEEADHGPAVEVLHEPGEDLWQTAAATPSRKRRKRSSGPDPIVIGMGVLLLCLVAIGVVVIVTSNKPPTDELANNPTAGGEDAPALPDRTPEQVQTISNLVTPRFEMIRDAGVPDSFTDRFAQIRTLIEQAQAYNESEQLSQAYQQYAQARDLIGPLENEIAEYELNEKIRGEVNELLKTVTALRQEAVDAEAQKWASVAWNTAEFAWKKVPPMMEAGQFSDADKTLVEAQSMYQMSIGRAETGKSAAKAREAMFAAMKSGPSEDTLKTSTTSLYEEFIKLREQGEQLMTESRFEDAEGAFADATATLARAKKMIELARFAKYYASESGFKAATVLLGVASDAKIEPEKLTELTQAFEELALSPNPAARLTAGEEPDYGKVTEALINNARDTLTSAHGPEVQACYLIGFHMCIIDQTLNSTKYTDKQQKRVHQSLAVIEAEADSAGWDVVRLSPVIESVRDANRKAKSGSNPQALRDMWQKVLTPLRQRDTAIRVIDAKQFPGTPEDPQLFPGLGS